MSDNAPNSQLKDWLEVIKTTKKAIDSFDSAVAELRDLDDILTKISVTTNLTSDQLKSLAKNSFTVAEKLGTTAAEYLRCAQDMKLAGYENYEAMAQLSLVTQSITGMTDQMAKNYLTTADAVFGYNGNILKLNSLLDGQSQLAERNSVNMMELTSATKSVMDNFYDLGNIPADKLTALLGTGIASSHESAENVAKAVKSILMNFQQIEGLGGHTGDIIDEAQLKNVEKLCQTLGIQLRTVHDGISDLRDPLDILEDLAYVYNSLPDDSGVKDSLFQNMGSKNTTDILSSILSNWDQYQSMLYDYQNSTGSAFDQSAQSAEDWIGILNSISNHWTSFVSTLSDDKGFLSLLNIIEKITSAIDSFAQSTGALPIAAAAFGALLSTKNLGWAN